MPLCPREAFAAGLRDPEAILTEEARTLDFAQPVALMMLGVFHLFQSQARAAAGATPGGCRAMKVRPAPRHRSTKP